MGSLDLLAVLLASLAHDVGHPALTNRFLVNNRDALAIKYNDNSVLENMHCSLTFSIMSSPGCDLLQSLPASDWITLRKLVIDMIMYTDMSKHFEVLARFRTRAITLADFNLSVIEDKASVLAMGLKCADIGHSAKNTDLHVKWTRLVSEEFFAQGDMEKSKKQSVSMYCDRDNSDIPKSQVGFINNISLPLHEAWCKYLNSEVINTAVIEMLKNNVAYWESLIRKRKASVMLYIADEPTISEFKRIQSGF